MERGASGRPVEMRAERPVAEASPVAVQGRALTAPATTVAVASYWPFKWPLADATVTLGFAVAVFARFYRLGDIPPRLHHAEDAFRRATLQVLDHGWIGLWSAATEGQPAALAYWNAAWMRLLGESATALRLPAAALGLATVAMFYVLSRLLFGKRAAVLGSLLLALSAWHLGYSRLALPINALLLLELLALYLLFRAFGPVGDPVSRRRLLVLAGLSFGAGIYTHNTFFVLLLVVLAFWVRELLAGETPLGELKRKAIAFFVPALAVALPYLGYVALDAGDFSAQVRATAVSATPAYKEVHGVTEQSRYVLGNVGRTAKALVWRSGAGDQMRRLLDPATALLAVLGLVGALWRWRDRRHLFVLIMIAVAVVGVGLTADHGMYGRLVVALPAVYMSAGLALEWLLVLLKGRAPIAARYAVVAAVVAFAAAYNISAYYGGPLGPGTLV